MNKIHIYNHFEATGFCNETCKQANICTELHLCDRNHCDKCGGSLLTCEDANVAICESCLTENL